MTGKGIYRSASRDVYEGDWLDNNKHGKGIYRWSSGNYFQGDLIDNKMTTGQMFLSDANREFTAAFSGGDDVLADLCCIIWG